MNLTTVFLLMRKAGTSLSDHSSEVKGWLKNLTIS